VRYSGDHHREYPIIGCISWEFLIDPVAHPPEAECDWDDDGECIDETPELVLVSPYKNKQSNHNSEKSSMEAHPSFPYLENSNRMLYEVCEIVEENIPNTTSEYDPDKNIRQKSVYMLRLSETIESPHEKITNNKTQSIRESIPGWSYMETVK
jgi:hypothetical protein